MFGDQKAVLGKMVNGKVKSASVIEIILKSLI